MPKLTQERLMQALDYDPATGVFVWKTRPSNRIHVGDRAGLVGTNGRRFIMVDGEKFQAHRLAWFYTHGVWPDGDLKQKNGDYDDCSLDNLVPITRIEQARLRSTLSTNTSGLRGVSRTPKGRWQSHVTANYQQINLGVFKTPEEASAAYEHAMSFLEGARTPEECEAAADKIIQHRRKRVAWDRLLRSGRAHEWPDFETFFAEVGSMDDDQSTVAAVNPALPISGSNFRWLLRPDGKHDRSTLEGRAAYAKAYREANPGRWRHAHMKANYKIDEVEYHRMLKAQGGICLICESDPVAEFLAIDHCHKTGQVRGLLCKTCNYAMGLFGDNPDRLRRAADFLDGGDKLEWSTPTITEITHTPLGQMILQEAAGHG